MTATATTGPSGLTHAFVLDGAGGGRALDWAGVDAWTPDDGVLWLNLDYSLSDGARWIATNLDDIARDALLDIDPRPRAFVRGDDLLMIVRGINLNVGAAPEDMISIRASIGPRRVVTLRHRTSTSIATIASDLVRGVGPRDAAGFTSALIEHIVEHVVTRVDTIGDVVASCEDQVLADARGDVRARLADQRRRAIALRRFLAPQRDALVKLAGVQLPWLAVDDHARYAESADRLARTLEELDAARDRAAVTQEELQSRIGEVTNQRLYLLSLITAVFLPLGFVCALLSVPLDHDEWPFWLLCGVCAIGAGTQIVAFKRRGWLG
nr:CorA family divalent cation transporter [Kofleriaceae bacterium]